MGHVIDINKKRSSTNKKNNKTETGFISSKFYAHNSPLNLENTSLLLGGVSWMVLFSAILWTYGTVPLAISGISTILGVTLGVAKYYFFPYSMLSIYSAGEQPVQKTEPAKVIRWKDAA